MTTREIHWFKLTESLPTSVVETSAACGAPVDESTYGASEFVFAMLDEDAHGLCHTCSNLWDERQLACVTPPTSTEGSAVETPRRESKRHQRHPLRDVTSFTVQLEDGSVFYVRVSDTRADASPPCTHTGAVHLYHSHGGFAQWCPKCGAARSSYYEDDSVTEFGNEAKWPWMPPGTPETIAATKERS